MKKLSENQVDELIQIIIGTNDTLTEAIQECFGEAYDETSLDTDSLTKLNNYCFKCEICEWWYLKKELASENTCKGCSELYN